MSIQTLVGRNGPEVVTIHAAETVKNAADRMRAHGVTVLVVKSGDAIIGLLSERDIVHAIARHGEGAVAMAALGVMSHAIVTVAPGDSIKHAMSLMVHHRMRDLPVIANGKLVGIVGIGDVAKHRMEDLVTESNVLRDAYIAAH